MLRPRASDESCWQASLEIPDLSHLVFRFPTTRDALTGSRCVVAGASGRPLARGRCLHGAQRVTLSRWPREDEVLLQFEEAAPQLEYLLRVECLLRPGPLWLFRIASDGLAYESRSLRVRPGERYVIVSTDGPIASNPLARPIDLQCAEVFAALLDLPPALTSDWDEVLRGFGLGRAKSVEIWPAGLGAVVWDGEGRGEWPASERPCLAIRTDHAVAALVISIDTATNSHLEVTPVPPGEPIFVELQQLPVGLHKLRVAIRSNMTTPVEPLSDLEVVLQIREARPWGSIGPSGPLVVQVDPPSPTLEQLWEGQVDIEVRGPTDRRIKCIVSLFEGAGTHPTIVETIQSMSLPLTPEGWRAHFEKHFREVKKAQEKYDAARLCRLEFAAGELGAFTIECEREFVPLRWALRQRGGDSVACLIDDSGSADTPEVLHFTFERPVVAVQLLPSREFAVSPPGGLFVARRRDFSTAVLGVPRTIRNLHNLSLTPEIEDRPRSAEAVLSAIGIGGLWGSARSSGDILSLHRRRNVLHALSRHVFLLIGGERWANAERDVVDGSDVDLSRLKRTVATRRDQVGVAAALALEIDALALAEVKTRVARLAELAVSFKLLESGKTDEPVDNAIWLAEFSLRLASSLKEVSVWAGPLLRPAIVRLMEGPVVARAARFLVIATDRHLQSRVAPHELYASWGWA